MSQDLGTAFEQFKELEVPEDIQDLQKFEKQQLEQDINEHRDKNKLSHIDFSKGIRININGKSLRLNEINIHTIDFFFNYTPDFEWTHLSSESDPWRRTCILKNNFQRFIDLGVEVIRNEGNFHKLHICEIATFLEDSFKILKDNGVVIIKYLDVYACASDLISNKSIKRMEYLEKLIFSESDPTGLYYNKSILSLERIEYYATKTGFKTVEKDDKNSDAYNTTLIIKK